MKQLNKPRNSIKQILIFTLILSAVAFVVGGFFFGQKEKLSNSGLNIFISPTPVNLLKTYKNTKYGFEFSYPARGIIQNDQNFQEGDCGNFIKETGNNIFVDNLFKIEIVNWSRTIDDYLIQRGAKNKYDFTPILNSNADEALEVTQIKKGLELVAVGYPPLMNILDIYKKGENIFLIEDLENKNNGGCISPKEVDRAKFPNFANQNWGVKDSFKFN